MISRYLQSLRGRPKSLLGVGRDRWARRRIDAAVVTFAARPAVAPYLLRCSLGLLLFLVAWSGVAAATDEKKEDVVILTPFVVTEKSRGIIPLNGWFRCNRFTGKIKSTIAISGAMVSQKPLADYGVVVAEQIVAVNGQRIIGMDKSDLIRLWMETGDAGDVVKLTLRGVGEDSSVFREISLKRITPSKRFPTKNP